MPVSVARMIDAYRVCERFAITSAETIPANADGGVGLQLVSNRLTLATAGSPCVGVSNQREARIGDADGTIFGKFDPGDDYQFKFPQGDLLDAQVAVGENLDWNAAADGFQVGSADDAVVVGHTTDSLGNPYVIVRLLNVQPVLTP